MDCEGGGVTRAGGAGSKGPERASLRVLVVDEALPYPPDSGKRLRTWHLLRRLARRHQVVLLCYAAPADPGRAAAVAALAAVGIECHTLPPPPPAQGWRLHLRLLRNCFSVWPYSVAKHHSRRFRTALRNLCVKDAAGRVFDLLQIEWTPYASHVDAPAPPHLIASHNIEAQIWRRRADVAGSPAARLFFRWQAAKMRRFERWAFRRARAVTTVSGADRNQALGMGARSASVVANGVDLDFFHPMPAATVADRLLFLGALDWFPNQDAVVYFVDAILPLIRTRRPGVALQVVGRRPSLDLRRRLGNRAGVELVGEIEDVRPLLAAAAVAIVPLRVGGGSRIKILEALAMEKAVVATSIGAEGLELYSGTHLLIADGPQQFARLTTQLLNSPAQAARLGHAGGRFVRDHYNWDDCALALESAWWAATLAAPARGVGARP